MFLKKAPPAQTKASRTRHLTTLTLSLLLLGSNATADDTIKPAERKRHGGIQPFTQAQIEDFLSERRNAPFATINKDGSPQLTPVIYDWEEQPFTFQSQRKRSNIKTSSEIPG